MVAEHDLAEHSLRARLPFLATNSLLHLRDGRMDVCPLRPIDEDGPVVVAVFGELLAAPRPEQNDGDIGVNLSLAQAIAHARQLTLRPGPRLQ